MIKLFFHSIISILIVLLLISVFDFFLIFIIKTYAFSPPSWTNKVLLGGMAFLGLSLYFPTMVFLYTSKFVLKPFQPSKFTLWIIGIISLTNFIYLNRELWIATPNFSFWNIISFIMCMTVFSFNILFVGLLGDKN